MFNKTTLILALVLSIPLVAAAGELDGKEFCRTIVSDGMFGQPAGERTHCVRFNDNVMTDDANTFFGNPPESINYVLVSGKILVVRDGNLQADYKINKKMTQIENEVGAKLNLIK